MCVGWIVGVFYYSHCAFIMILFYIDFYESKQYKYLMQKFNYTNASHKSSRSGAFPVRCKRDMVGSMVLIGRNNARRAHSTVRTGNRSSMRAVHFFELLAQSSAHLLAPIH